MLRKTLFATSILVLVAAAGCKSTPPPSATFKAYFEAQKKKDIPAMKQTLSKTSLAMMEASAKQQQLTLDKMIEGQLNNPSATVDKMPESRNEKITGDSATLELHNEDANRWDTMYFVKEDGAWKIALDRTVEEMLRKNGS
ncbi:MAG TPA: nuclear transport factor 2 family protein [Pyrinomonadaceae bacterium]|nr:nuclear transport factor 2 family protein [Pyrinomonadaceae bacterium]